MFCYTFVVWKSSATPRARSEAAKMALLKLTGYEVEAVPSTCFKLCEEAALLVLSILVLCRVAFMVFVFAL